MLHRKLILTLGSLIVMMLAMSIWAIVLFALAVSDLSEMGASLLRQTTAITSIETSLGRIESKLVALQDNPAKKPEGMSENISGLQRQIDELNAAREQPVNDPVDLVAQVEQLSAPVTAIESTSDVNLISAESRVVLNMTMAMRQALTDVSTDVQERFDARHAKLTTQLRWWAFGLGLAFLLVINLSIMVILRAAAMVLKPVDELLEANRHLAREEFDYRVPVDRRDEFGELARATNAVAEELSMKEQRRFEVLQQIARTLNHELNNAIAIIDLQLRLIAKQEEASVHGQNAERWRQIHETLGKMSRTVASLGRVRKVVLMDYVGGTKMVDLQRSIEADDAAVKKTPAPAEAHGST